MFGDGRTDLLSDVFKLPDMRILLKNDVFKVRGNYSVVSGDPFALCQSIFGLEVTGLLKAGEIYNDFWTERAVPRVVCFRAPMTCHNNIRIMNIRNDAIVQYWYRHMRACTILNAWDTAAHALNGLDKDGDIVLLSDNEILLQNTLGLSAIICEQRKAEKRDITEDELIYANMDSFGSDIGPTTNRITGMFDVMAGFSPASREYRELEYRIKCGQLYQQNAIDKAKGIIAKPMPRYWYDRSAAKSKAETPGELEFLLSIVADKKPYFMRYIYPQLMRQYNQYIKNTNKKALREFRRSIDELLIMSADQRSDEENDFVHYYRKRMPVSTNNSTVNRICRLVEDSFDGGSAVFGSGSEFDYTIMKSGADYSDRTYRAVLKIYNDHNRSLAEYMQQARQTRISEAESLNQRELMVQYFKTECHRLCPDERALCDIILDICYQKNSTKQFAWDICEAEIIENLLAKNGYRLSFPVADENGDIEYGGNLFSTITIQEEQETSTA